MLEFAFEIYGFLKRFTSVLYNTYPHPESFYILAVLYVFGVIKLLVFDKPLYTTEEKSETKDLSKEEECKQ